MGLVYIYLRYTDTNIDIEINYTLDNYMYDNKKIWFGLTVALIAFTNWYFFIAEGVFLFLYFLVKIITKEYKIKMLAEK